MAKQKDAEQIRILTTFFENMEKAITNKDTTRNKLKKETGVSLERYKISEDMREPSLSAAVKIADALDVSLDELCGRTAYFHNSNELSAGEALELILILINSLFGTVSDDGHTISLLPSNVTTVFKDCHEFGKHYAGMKKFDPDNYPLEAKVAEFNWLSSKIEELKKNKETIEVFPYFEELDPFLEEDYLQLHPDATPAVKDL